MRKGPPFSFKWVKSFCDTSVIAGDTVALLDLVAVIVRIADGIEVVHGRVEIGHGNQHAFGVFLAGTSRVATATEVPMHIATVTTSISSRTPLKPYL